MKCKRQSDSYSKNWLRTQKRRPKMTNENQWLIDMYRAYLWNNRKIDIPLDQLDNLEDVIEIIQRLHKAYQLGKPKTKN